MNIQFKGQDVVDKNLRRIAKNAPREAGRALYLVAERKIMTPSKRDHVPVDLGNLRDTGMVEPFKENGTIISVRLVYGGPAAPYALSVHEHPSEFDPISWKGKKITFSPPGHGPKFLEKPLLAEAPDLTKDVAATMKLENL